MAQKKYEFLEHTADMKFRAQGNTLEEVFESAISAFSNFIADGAKIKTGKKKKIKVDGDDKENLLYNFLEELIYLLDAENFIVARGKVKIKGNTLSAELLGDKASAYSGIYHVKAPTYSEIFVQRRKGKWKIQAVLDV